MGGTLDTRSQGKETRAVTPLIPAAVLNPAVTGLDRLHRVRLCGVRFKNEDQPEPVWLSAFFDGPWPTAGIAVHSLIDLIALSRGSVRPNSDNLNRFLGTRSIDPFVTAGLVSRILNC
jgi:hypothetical protein